MLYSQLALIGKFTLDELKQLRQWGSPTPGHPEVDVMRGIENTSGPLGQGHVFAVGAAIAAKFLAARTGNPTFEKETIYAYISDGGIQEEISQGSGRIAGHLGLNNLVMFYDSNDIQLSTETKDVITEDTAMKYRAWGWNVIEINGNDCEQIREALKAIIDLKPALDEGKLDDRILRDLELYQNRAMENALTDLLPRSLIPVVDGVVETTPKNHELLRRLWHKKRASKRKIANLLENTDLQRRAKAYLLSGGTTRNGFGYLLK